MIGFLMLLSIPSVSFASEQPPLNGAGEWDIIYQGTINANGGRTPIAYSGGGDVRVCINGVNAYNYVSLRLYSDNGSGDSVDDPVLPEMNYWNSNSTQTTRFCFSKIDADFYKDGSNHLAEFYVKSTASFNDNVVITIED
ncbi:hypothetical protein [Terrilactibacillus laevilacticus]|uniref:Secreted protein n=2 Tax=Terrilactibacillus laevilacticus TaxID=1380157 RepID=A0ABW5PU52_9BACI